MLLLCPHHICVCACSAIFPADRVGCSPLHPASITCPAIMSPAPFRPTVQYCIEYAADLPLPCLLRRPIEAPPAVRPLLEGHASTTPQPQSGGVQPVPHARKNQDETDRYTGCLRSCWPAAPNGELCQQVCESHPWTSTIVDKMYSLLRVVAILHCACLQTNHILDSVSKCSSTDLCLELRHHGGDSNQLDYWIGKREPMIVHRPQVGGELGDKMAGAFSDAFKEGARFVVVVSSLATTINNNKNQQ